MRAEVEDAIMRTLRLAIMDQLEGSLPRLEMNLAQIEQTLRSVLDLALSKRGIGLEELAIAPGETTAVSLTLSLASDTIEAFEVELRFKSDTPFLAYITQAERTGLAQLLQRDLGGTPYADSSWVERLTVGKVEEYLARKEEYSGFDPLVLVLPGTTTRVYVTLLPKPEAAAVERYFIKLRSNTMLNLQLADAGALVSANLESLRGLPVAFVEAKSDEICEFLAREAVAAPGMEFLRPQASAELYVVHKDVSLVLNADSERFKLRASGRVDLSREQNVARLDFTAGLRLTPSTDLLVHGTFYPGDFELRPQMGVGLSRSAKALLEAGYDFKMNSLLLRGQVNLLPDFYISAEHYVKSRLKDENEYGLTYIFRNYYELKLITDFRDELFASVGVRI